MDLDLIKLPRKKVHKKKNGKKEKKGGKANQPFLVNKRKAKNTDQEKREVKNSGTAFTEWKLELIWNCDDKRAKIRKLGTLIFFIKKPMKREKRKKKMRSVP